MGSGAGAVEEAAAALRASGEKVGVLKVRLYRPFDGAAFAAALPATTTRARRPRPQQGPGSRRRAALRGRHHRARRAGRPARAPHRRPLRPRLEGVHARRWPPPSSPSSTPRSRAATSPSASTTTSPTRASRSTPRFQTEADDVVRCVFYGLGSDGTVGANKNSAKIIGTATPLFSQGYFVIDSKKSGSTTVSHLRFGPRPIRSSYLIESAQFVACHQFDLLRRMDVLAIAAEGATVLLNAPYGPDDIWDRLPRTMQEEILAKHLRLYVINASKVAREAGLARPREHDPPGVLLRALRRAAGAARDRRDQGGDRDDVREARRRGRAAQLPRRRPRPRRAARGGRPPLRQRGERPRRDPRRRARSHPRAHRRPRRPPARQRAPGRRHLPVRHVALRAAQPRRRAPDLGRVDLHRLRQVRARLPARGDPHEGLRPLRARGRARRLQVEGVEARRTCRGCS